MNKILTGVVIAAVIVLVVFLICGLLGPQGFRMERSIVIKAPATLIYKNLSDYRNWPKWSPWYELDTNCAYYYYGTQGQIGAGYKWKGNAKAGEGDMHTTGMTDGSSLTSQLSFIKPFASTAMATFNLEDTTNGATKVTWGFSQNYSFSRRPMMLFMNMDKMLGGDYEKGLAKLKALCEKQASGAAQGNIQVKEVDWTGRTYLAYRAEVGMKELGKVFQDKMPMLFTASQTGKLQMDGPPSGLYFTWDTVTHKTDMAVGIPVKDASKIAAPYKAITIGSSKALMVDYYGPYDQMQPAHEAIHKYAADKGLKLKAPAIEEYIGDPGAEKDPNKVLTRIYYLVY
jgi:effector-binding domain-containing protein